MFFTKEMYPKTESAENEIAALPDVVCRGGSCVIDPYGHEVTETIWDKEGIIYSVLDMQKVPASRMEHNVCGHYARPDVLKLTVLDE
jgi:nitrilase